MDTSSSEPIVLPEAPPERLSVIPPLMRPGGALALAQTIIDAGVAIELRPRDIALLVLIRQRIQTRGDGAISLTEGEIRGLARRIDELDISDPAGGEKRVTESLTRLMRAECLTRADMRRLTLAEDTELQLTSLGEDIADWHLEHGQFSGEPLTAILRAFTRQLAGLAEEAEQASSQEAWEDCVLSPMKHVLKDMLVSIQRHQKELDRQHEELRSFIPALLSESSEASIDLCEKKLATVGITIRDLHEVTLTSTTAASTLLARIESMGESGSITGLIQNCGEIERRLQSISQWTNQRLSDWGEHHRVVHDFLRDVVRIDRSRRLTEALKHSVAESPTWTLSVANAPYFVRLPVALGEVRPLAAPRRKREDHSQEVTVVALDDLRERLDALLTQAIQSGEARMSALLASMVSGGATFPTLAAKAPWLVAQMASAGRVDQCARNWVSIGAGAEVEELRITPK